MFKSLFGILLMTTLAAPAFACEPPAPHPAYLLVGNKGEDTLSFINLKTGEEVSRQAVSANAPHEIAISPNGAFAAVVNYGAASIDIFDIGFRSRVKTIDLGENKNPHGLLWLSDDRIIATTEGSDTLVVLSPNHIPFEELDGGCYNFHWDVTAIPTGQDGTHMVATSPDETIAYTANMQSASISRIDLNSGAVRSTPAGKEVEGVAVTKDGREVWASVRGEDRVIVFDADTLSEKASFPVGDFPLRILVSPDGEKMVTSNLMDGSISVIDVASRKVERTITVSGTREAAQVTLLFSDDGTRLYAAETGTDTVAEIDFASGKVLRRIKAGRQGDGLAIVPAFME